MNFTSPFKAAMEDIGLKLTIWRFGLQDIPEISVSFLLRKNMMAMLTISVNLEWHLFALLILLKRFMKTLLIRNEYLPAQSYMSFWFSASDVIGGQC